MLKIRRGVAFIVLAMDALYYYFVLFAVPLKVPHALVGFVFCVTSLGLLVWLTKPKTKIPLILWFAGAGILCGLGGGYSAVSYGIYGTIFKSITPMVILLHSYLTGYAAERDKDNK